MELQMLKYKEVSVDQVGAKQTTELLAVKERIAQLKNGPLSKSNEGQLREAISLIEGVLSSLDEDRKSTRLNSSHVAISYAVFCLKKKKKRRIAHTRW